VGEELAVYRYLDPIALGLFFFLDVEGEVDGALERDMISPFPAIESANLPLSSRKVADGPGPKGGKVFRGVGATPFFKIGVASDSIDIMVG
jgi:hypothetical protein